MAETTRREQDPRSYAGQQDDRPGLPGGEERTTMARAGAAPVPVMANTHKGAAPTAKGSAGKVGSADRAAAGKPAGQWGPSFDGTDGHGNKVTGLTWNRRFTRADVHPYDEIEWEMRT